MSSLTWLDLISCLQEYQELSYTRYRYDLILKIQFEIFGNSRVWWEFCHYQLIYNNKIILYGAIWKTGDFWQVISSGLDSASILMTLRLKQVSTVLQVTLSQIKDLNLIVFEIMRVALLMKIAFLNWKIKGFIEIIIKNFFSTRWKKCDSKIYILIRKNVYVVRKFYFGPKVLLTKGVFLTRRFHFWFEKFIYEPYTMIENFYCYSRVAYLVISRTKNFCKKRYQAYFVEMMWWLRISRRFYTPNKSRIWNFGVWVLNA